MSDGHTSTGQSIKAQAIRKATELVAREERNNDLSVYHQAIGRAERLEAIVKHPHFSEIEAILLEDVFALSYAKDENLLVRSSAARSSLRTMERIYEGIKRGEDAIQYLAEIDKTAREEKENAKKSGGDSSRRGRSSTRREVKGR